MQFITHSHLFIVKNVSITKYVVINWCNFKWFYKLCYLKSSALKNKIAKQSAFHQNDHSNSIILTFTTESPVWSSDI